MNKMPPHVVKEFPSSRQSTFDIAVVIEKEIAGEKVPLPLVIREVNEKPLGEIHAEIKTAEYQQVSNERDYVLGKSQFTWGMKLFLPFLQRLRLIIWRLTLKDPFSMKQMSGTIVVTSVGMRGKSGVG